MTAQLAKRARRVTAVEIDPHWASRLRGRWANVAIVEGDAAAMRLPEEPFRVVANLPFGQTTELLRLLLDDPGTQLVRADVIVEWGVAVKRAIPWPATLNDVLWGAFYEVAVARRLPRSAFEPQPSVDAGLLIVRRRALPLVPPALVHQYRRFVARGFRHGLRAVAPRAHVERLDNRAATARELDAHQWAELFGRKPPS